MPTKLGFANLTSLLFNFFTISNIIYNKQSHYDQVIQRNNWNAYYDYVVIGGGTAGSVLASRLAEDPDVTVLLLEAGGSETVTSNTPGLSDTLIGTVMDWKYKSTPQNHSCMAMNGGQCHLASGRVIGGTSSINRMYYLRGNPADFDRWETSFGLKGWAWKDVFPYMIRNENQKDPELAKTGYYGLNGPVFIEKLSPLKKESSDDKILETFLSASMNLGYRNTDLNTGVSNGSAILQSTINQGKRQSMSSIFLEPHLKNRPNLHVLANSVATQVLFEKDRAIGVKFQRDWQQHSVYARQEVILSCGTFGSPKLLWLSGVGPRQDLNRLGIPVVADLPVGENLHDHVGSLGLYFVAHEIPESGVTQHHLKQYFYYGKGPLSEYRYGSTVFRKKPSFDHHQTSVKEDQSPDLMLLTYINGLTNRELSPELTEQQINLKRSVWNTYYGEKLKANQGKLQFTIIPIVLKPKSRGTLRLKSANPFDPPLIDPNYLGDPDDLEQIVRAMREALKMIHTKPFDQYRTEWYRSMLPGCESEYKKFESEIEWTTLFQNDNDNKPNKEISSTERPLLSFEDIRQQHEIALWSSSTTTSDSDQPTTPSSSKNQIPSQVYNQINLPFHFMSSFMSKLFRKSSLPLKKIQKTGTGRRVKRSDSNFTSFYYDQYWLGGSTNLNYNHPLINKTIYGGLVDGFSSSSTPSLNQNNQDQSIITVSNSHSDRRRPKPPSDSFPSSSSSSSHYPTVLELPEGVSPIVLTGFFSSPPKIQTQSLTTATTAVTTTTTPSSSINHHPSLHYYHYHNYHRRPIAIDPPHLTKVSNDNQHNRIKSSTTTNVIDKYLKCMAKMLTMPIGDYVGTCRMGSRFDRKRVVDERFRVVGLNGLRVVDNSIVPEITTGGMASVAIMLGERGAEMIREDRKQSKH